MIKSKRRQTSVKLPQETLDQIKALGIFWGPIKTLSQADVVIESVRLAYEDSRKRIDRK